jgi:hypothetical protein
MATLNQILQQEIQISVLASRFDFSDEVSIFNDGSYQQGKPLTLTLVVHYVPGKSEDPRRSDLLATKLSETLECKVKVLALEKKPLSSALLSDEIAVQELFNTEFLDEIVMKERDKMFYDQRLAVANQYLKDNAVLINSEPEYKRLKH